ncbi:alkaline phosphatase PhoX [Pontibacter pamirensis]|uniref:alkaline phosphatase PhoX n=1 Tax=Pontibacter pamirensis TaxID=2562824 RepID=UPI001389C33B|nr:alkaline phosphatase PhoX [Pontibacter pamirensis]
MDKFYKRLLMAAIISGAAVTFQETAAQSATSAGSGSPNKNKIGSFTSVQPIGQSETITYPTETHAIQQLAKTGFTSYTDGSTGTMPGNNDFTAFIPIKGSSKKGYLAINHETTPGGVSILDMTLNEATNLWEVEGVRKVDFSPLVQTVRNCSGGITPWGTLITSEETYNSGDANGDGYQDVGWQVEIDPATGKIVDYDGDGKPDKLWAMGRMNHENIAIGADRVTVYQAEDGGSSGVFKFVANTPGNLSEGTLYVLKRDSETAATGTWVVVPNTTQADRNSTRSLAPAVGGTNWRNPEDIEFGPDGKMYFTSKGTGTIWRFKDDGMTVSEIEAWVTPQLFEVKYNGGTQTENWGTGIDNLTFDGDGNLWALQDGGRNNLWVVRPDHTPENPKLELFLTTPFGSESTGLTFSPDFKYGFVSIQHPRQSNLATFTDAAGNEVQFNRDITFVFARKQFLGRENRNATALVPANMVEVYPNPFQAVTKVKVEVPEQGLVSVEVLDMQGQKVATLYNGNLEAGEYTYDFSPSPSSGSTIYLVRMQVNNQKSTTRIIQVNE